MGDVWAVGEAYEAYVGRWSRPVAAEFLRWLTAPEDEQQAAAGDERQAVPGDERRAVPGDERRAVPAGGRWLDAGCGTGALTGAVLAAASPALVVGVDMSRGFLAEARAHLPAARFVAGDACALPLGEARFDAVVSGLALNFVPGPQRAVNEFARAAAPGATVAVYVWDYTTGMQMMRHFWDASLEVDPAAADQDEGPRFPICHPGALAQAWTDAGLRDVETRPIEIPTVFADFDNYWRPFLGGQGAAPAYLARLRPDRQRAIRDLLEARLPRDGDGKIALTARAWAVRGEAPR